MPGRQGAGPPRALAAVRLASAGPARLTALHDALTATQEANDGALVVRWGRPEEVVPAVAAEVAAESIHESAETTPYGRRRDGRVTARG